MSIQKTIFVVTITRGSKTRFFYGEKLKDALAAANPRNGEAFQYAKFGRAAVQQATWNGSGTYTTELVAA